MSDAIRCFKTGGPCTVDVQEEPRSVLVIMPFAGTFGDVYELGIKASVEGLGWECQRADEIIHNRDIVKDSTVVTAGRDAHVDRERSLAIREKVGDEHGMSTTFNNLGAVYQDRGEWERAIECYERSLALTEKVGDEHGMAPTLNNLGEVYRVKGEWERAIEYYERSLAIKEKVGDEVGTATTMYNTASLYEDMERYDEALELLERVVEIDERVGHPALESDRKTLERIRRKAK